MVKNLEADLFFLFEINHRLTRKMCNEDKTKREWKQRNEAWNGGHQWRMQ